jgi:hypothetical protein
LSELLQSPTATGTDSRRVIGPKFLDIGISQRVRPHTAQWEDGVTCALATWTLFGLFWDGLLHNNLVGKDNFWSSAHIAIYAGLTALGAWIGLTLLRHQRDIRKLDISDIPQGYGLAILALPLAAIAGPADFLWHAAYGFENQIDAPYSWSHQALFLSGGLLAAIPVVSAFRRPTFAPRLKPFLPAIFSMTAIVGVALFLFQHVVPFFVGQPATQDFQDDIAGRADAFQPGSDVTHVEGLSKALTHYGDDAFPYYFYSTLHTVAGIMIVTAVLVSAVLFMQRRWRLPAGTLTIMFGTLAVLISMLSEYRDWELAVPLVIGGVAGDLLLARLAGDEPVRVWKLRVFAAALPIVLWGAFLLCVALLDGGLGWGPSLWVGVLLTSGGVGYVLSLLAYPPAPPQQVS